MKEVVSFPEPRILDAIRYRIREPFVAPFCDRHTVLPQQSVSLKQRSHLRSRYKSAARGLPQTDNEERLCAFKDAYKGCEIWLLGNGPSLNELDLNFLKSEITIGTNGILLGHKRMGFSVTHYVVEDFLVAEDRAEQIKEVSTSQVWAGNYLAYCLGPNASTIWLNVSPFLPRTAKKPRFSFDARRILYSGGTVSYLCLQLAYYLGASQVNLVGFDHSYVEPVAKHRFGSIYTSNAADQNHFREDYFGPGYRWHRPNVTRMERAYAVARTAFESSGRNILNRGPGGNLEVFKRLPLS